MREVALGLGVIAFDGRVLELFGFGEQGSRRYHLAEIRAIGLDGPMLSIDTVPASIGAKLFMPALDDAQLAALRELVDEVARAVT